MCYANLPQVLIFKPANRRNEVQWQRGAEVKAGWGVKKIKMHGKAEDK